MDISKYRPHFVGTAEQRAQQFPAGRVCLMCPTGLDTTLKYYCSGGCIEKAKQEGIYGHESN